jgi:hypothetical protein
MDVDKLKEKDSALDNLIKEIEEFYEKVKEPAIDINKNATYILAKEIQTIKKWLTHNGEE